jgi:hypothetical protein
VRTQQAAKAQSAAAKTQSADAKAADGDEEEAEQEKGPNPVVEWLGDQASWLTSMVFHTILILVLAIITFEKDLDFAQMAEALPPAEEEKIEDVEPLDVNMNLQDLPENELAEAEEIETEFVPDMVEAGIDAASQPMIEDMVGDLPPNEIFREIGRGSGVAEAHGTGKAGDGIGNGAGGRSDRRAGALGRGATKESEDAVELALRWLANHQLPDGSWSFDHRGGECQGRCQNHGSFAAARNGATAMALLPFLGAGHTHLEGKYQANVAAGLKFMLSTLKVGGAGDVGSWHEEVGNATNYSHGIASLAMCEAYAMSLMPRKAPQADKSLSEMTDEERKAFLEQKRMAKLPPPVPSQQLGRAAQLSLNYIMQAQHPGGGWRYNPGQPGDTSVVGWMLMALKSGHMSKLRIAPATVIGANAFLDSVASGQYGTMYGYTGRDDREPARLRATTAIGLLSRMYLGWDKNHPGIAEGVRMLSEWGPSIGAQDGTNMYFNYYATQVMHHYGGDMWKAWNVKMRDHLINTQRKDDHQTGSWHFDAPYGSSQGGRLYNTAMAAMTLEVYYRYMPIYGSKSVEDDLAKPAAGAPKNAEPKDAEPKEAEPKDAAPPMNEAKN